MKNIFLSFIILSTSFFTIDSYAQIDDALDNMFKGFESSGSPSASVVLIKNNEIVANKCYGFRDIENGKKADQYTQYCLADLSFHYSILATLLLEEEGKLKLNEKINAILTDLPEFTNKITVKNLLMQNSGLLPYTIKTNINANKTITYHDVYQFILDSDSLKYSPGRNFMDKNICNNVLLAMLIEKKSGTTYEKYISTNLIEPLGLKNTTILTKPKLKIKNYAKGYTALKSGFKLNMDYQKYFIKGFNGIYSNISDYAKIVNAFTNNSVVDQEKLKSVFKFKFTYNQSRYPGFGWNTEFLEGKKCHYYSNNFFGTTHLVFYYPAEQIKVILLANHNAIFGLREAALEIINLISTHNFSPGKNKLKFN